ncbi:MAG: hypothetical protein HYU97_06065 [Deltaproteobacteria bacterium]|nr:hypothetical protein [Deltaproteobacteria bacterium]
MSISASVIQTVCQFLPKPKIVLPPPRNILLPLPSPKLDQYSPPKVGNDAASKIASIKTDLRQKLAQLDEKTQQELTKINSKRQSKGQAPIDFKKINEAMLQIMENFRLSPDEKKQAIEALRKEYGLSKKEMKNLFTKRFQAHYQAASRELQNYSSEKERALTQSIEQAQRTYGVNSGQALSLQNQLNQLKATTATAQNQFNQQANTTGSMYKGGFWSKLKGAFKKIGGFLKKGIGALVKKVWLPVTKAALKIASKVAPFIPGPWGKLASLAQPFFNLMTQR